MPLRVGVTGGIGSGKSAVCGIFADRHGTTVIGADAVARDLVAPGQTALDEIVKIFGADSVDATGHLRRDKLRALIFSDACAKARLEAILHPLINAEIARRSALINDPYVLIEIPLLAEARTQYTMLGRILVIDAPQHIRKLRVMDRDDLSDDEVSAIMHGQIGREARLTLADEVILNDAGMDNLVWQVDKLHAIYAALGRASTTPVRSRGSN